ncbi:MAG: hypothetical protein IPH82_29475 [Chloroflexi bacterium]|nr:hypothetical protein [Chloroflexota bacterium]
MQLEIVGLALEMVKVKPDVTLTTNALCDEDAGTDAADCDESVGDWGVKEVIPVEVSAVETEPDAQPEDDETIQREE